MFLTNLKNIYTLVESKKLYACSLDREERCDVTKIQICEIMRLVGTFRKNKMKIATVTTTTTTTTVAIIIIIIIIIIINVL